MKTILVLLIFSTLVTSLFAQNTDPSAQANYKKAMSDFRPHFGIKGGYNIAKAIGSSPTFQPDYKNGFMVGAFFSPKSKGGLGYRTELVFSRQGFTFDQNNKLQRVSSDYIYMPHF